MKTMKKFAALMMLLCALMICTIPALAANESGSDSDVTEAMARQPEATSQIRTTMMMGLVFIETVIIYALIVAILIIFVL